MTTKKDFANSFPTNDTDCCNEKDEPVGVSQVPVFLSKLPSFRSKIFDQTSCLMEKCNISQGQRELRFCKDSGKSTISDLKAGSYLSHQHESGAQDRQSALDPSASFEDDPFPDFSFQGTENRALPESRGIKFPVNFGKSPKEGFSSISLTPTSDSLVTVKLQDKAKVEQLPKSFRRFSMAASQREMDSVDRPQHKLVQQCQAAHGTLPGSLRTVSSKSQMKVRFSTKKQVMLYDASMPIAAKLSGSRTPPVKATASIHSSNYNA